MTLRTPQSPADCGVFLIAGTKKIPAEFLRQGFSRLPYAAKFDVVNQSSTFGFRHGKGFVLVGPINGVRIDRNLGALRLFRQIIHDV